MTPRADGLDAVASALAHSGRRRILARLAEGPATTSELAAELGVALPTTLRHLSVLDAAGLLHSTKSGRVVTHTLSPEPLRPLGEQVDAWLAVRSSWWSNQFDALEASLDAPDPERS